MSGSEIIELRTRARAGDAKALAALGKRLLMGIGVAPSPAEGRAMLENAAERGSGEAMTMLAVLAAWGLLQPRDLERGLDMLVRAAKRGFAPAQRELQFLARQAGTDWQVLRRAIDLAAWTAHPAARAVSEAPRIRVFEGFCSAGECAWLIGRAQNNLKRAKVYSRDSGGHMTSDVRTNSEADFTANVADVVLSLVRDRVAAAAAVPVSHFEVTKLLHYEPGQQFSAHGDFIETNTPALARDVEQHGQRAATFLVYLNDDYEGGETDFPKVNFRFKGRRGDALLFFNVLPDGGPDYSTVHAGLPPTSGVKWLLSQWIRSRPLSAT